ncbi:hypothetical protein [Streptomyces sp. NPDC056730]|uniref:hypothetical protein n=1 Tax=unclassified Streptomyces TaxID=2593676 RepID=UPI0036C10280
MDEAQDLTAVRVRRHRAAQTVELRPVPVGQRGITEVEPDARDLPAVEHGPVPASVEA